MSELTERRLLYIAVASAGVLLLAISYPLLTGEVYTDSDFGKFHMPFKFWYADALAKGYDFIWSPYQFNGFYVHGEGQLNLYHPLNLLCYRFLPFDTAFTLELVRNYVFLLVGMVLFARRWDIPAYAAVLAATLFSYSSFNMLHFMHLNVIAILAHMPFVLYAIDIAMRTSNRQHRALAIVSISLLTASQLLFGHPQFAWFSLFTEGLYVLYLLRRVGGTKQLPWLVLAQLLGFLLASIALLPQWESLENSFRAAPSSKFAFSMSLHPMRLTQFVAPFLLADRTTTHWTATELVVYNGAMMPLFMSWLFMRRRELGDLGPRIKVILWFALFMLVISLGNYGLLYLIVAKVPVVGLFRGPGRYMVLFQLATSLACAMAFIDLVRFTSGREALPWRRLLLLCLPLGASILTVLGWLIARRVVPDAEIIELLADPLHLAAGPLLVGVATALMLAAARGKRLALAAMLVFIVADQAIFGLSFMWREPRMPHRQYIKELKIPKWTRRHRAHFFHPAATMRGVKLAHGYVAMTPQQLLHLQVYGAFGHGSRSVVASMRAAGVGMAYGQIVPDPLPYVRLVTYTVETVSLNPQMSAIDLASTALVEEKIVLPAGDPGEVWTIAQLPGDLSFATRADTKQLLILAESFHSGWRATIDGRPCEILRVYYDFMGCVVDSGEHEIHFRFDPDSLRYGKRLSLLGLGLLAPFYFAMARGGVSLTSRKDSRES